MAGWLGLAVLRGFAGPRTVPRRGTDAHPLFCTPAPYGRTYMVGAIG
ncbi:hypothetical protein [Azospirillum argentinense]